MTDTTAATVETEAVDVRTIEFDGETYTVAADVFDDVEALEAFEDGKHTILCRTILGPSQWRTFKAKKRTVGELYTFLELVITSGRSDDE